MLAERPALNVALRKTLDLYATCAPSRTYRVSITL